MPDLDTRPIRPALVMSAGMMPALDLPGLIRPGQFGPMIRVVPVASAYARNSAVSCTGTPSVITTARPMPASIASIAAALVKAGGTKRTETSAPVSSIASATVPKTGTSAPSRSTVSPALRGLTPPTTWVPDGEHPGGVLHALGAGHALDDDLAVLGEPDGHGVSLSPSAVRRSQAWASSAALSAAPSMVSTRVTSGWFASLRIRRPSSTLLPSSRTTSGLVCLVAELLQGADDAVGDLVAGGDAAEDVDEDRLDLRVAEDDVEAVGHHLGRGAAADVEEVGRLHAAVLLTGVRDHVEGRHDQARAVADDADLAVELDVVEVLLLGRELERVLVLDELERRVVLVAEVGVVVERRPCRRAPRAVPSPRRTSGLTSTSVASSSTKTFQSVCTTSTACSATSAGKRVAVDDLARPWPRRRRPAGRWRPWRRRRGSPWRSPRSRRRPRSRRCRGSCGSRGRAGRRSSTPRRCRPPARSGPGARCGP